MSYVIYKPETYRIYKFPSGKQAIYDSERTALSQRTKLINAGVLKPQDWIVDSYATYLKNEPMITVKSLMTGKEVQIRKTEVGGCCDPSTERYWTM